MGEMIEDSELSTLLSRQFGQPLPAEVLLSALLYGKPHGSMTELISTKTSVLTNEHIDLLDLGPEGAISRSNNPT
jgi:hypothetical protein